MAKGCCVYAQYVYETRSQSHEHEQTAFQTDPVASLVKIGVMRSWSPGCLGMDASTLFVTAKSAHA